MLLGFLSGDYRKVAEVHFKAGFVPPDKSIDSFTQAIRSIAEPILGLPLNHISIAKLLGQLFQITETFAMETQPQLLLLQKSMLVAEGVGCKLSPDVNMWQLAQPLIEQWVMENLSPLARAKETAINLFGALETLPGLVREAERTVEALRGGLKVHPDSVQAIGKGGRRSIFPAWMPWLLAAVLAIMLLRR